MVVRLHRGEASGDNGRGGFRNQSVILQQRHTLTDIHPSGERVSPVDVLSC